MFLEALGTDWAISLMMLALWYTNLDRDYLLSCLSLLLAVVFLIMPFLMIFTGEL
jgi:hypothetical protein